MNYFIGWTQTELADALRNAQDDLAEGKATVAARGGDTSIASETVKSAEERIKMLLKSLNALDPINYPIADITPKTMTRACFSGEVLTEP